MPNDHGAEPQWLEEDEWISIYSMVDPATGEIMVDPDTGKRVHVYTFNDNYTGSHRPLHKGDWIRLRQALGPTSSRLTGGDMSLALSQLVGALRAAAITAIHVNITPESRAGQGGDFGRFERSYRYIYAYQWANSTVDVDEDSLNLVDGALLSDIFLNRKDVHDWLKARSDPGGPIHNDRNYQERRDQRHHEIGGGPRPVASPAVEKIKAKGGAPETYPWEKACVWLMVNSMFHPNCDGLTDRTPQKGICRLLRIALDAVSPGAEPSDSVVAEHAKYIQQAFRAADQNPERKAIGHVGPATPARQFAQRACSRG